MAYLRDDDGRRTRRRASAARAISAAKVQIGRSRTIRRRSRPCSCTAASASPRNAAVGHYYRRLTMLEILFGDANHHLAALAQAGGLGDS